MQPFHVPKQRWKDLVKSDLLSLGIGDGCWCNQARDRKQWQELCLQCSDDQQDFTRVNTVICARCGLSFRVRVRVRA